MLMSTRSDWFSTIVFASRLRFGDAFPLAFEHHFAFKLATPRRAGCSTTLSGSCRCGAASKSSQPISAISSGIINPFSLRAFNAPHEQIIHDQQGSRTVLVGFEQVFRCAINPLQLRHQWYQEPVLFTLLNHFRTVPHSAVCPRPTVADFVSPIHSKTVEALPRTIP